MEMRLTLLDACAVVGLFATRNMKSILASIHEPVGILHIVAEESQHVFRRGTGPDSRDREPIYLTALVDSGALSRIETQYEDELQTFIDLTRELGDGEALTAAIAIHRRWTVVSDDRKAERILRERGLNVRSTLELISLWSKQARISPGELRQVLIDLRQRATYEPGRNHPYRGWWESVLSE